MRAFRSFCIAIGLFSKIPVPRFKWQPEDMQYSFVFFPWVGAAIGALTLLWHWVCGMMGIGTVARVAVGIAIPLLVTGGFHVDGYMDTMDAFKSYGDRQEKLRILKDPHIGAFSVIMLALLGALFVAGLSLLKPQAVPVFALGYFFSRCLSGLAGVSVKCAKGEGLLVTFSESARMAPVIVRTALLVELIACGVLMAVLSLIPGLLAMAGASLTYFYYIKKSQRELGGITGDTEGYFVCICETVMVLVLGGYCVISTVVNI